MKIALIRKEYTLSWGGAESYVVNLSRQLLEMGHEVHVFANTWDERFILTIKKPFVRP